MGRYQKSLIWAFNQFVNRLQQNRSYRHDSGNCKPSRIIFCLTLRCNIKCKQCGIWRSPKKKELSLDEWKKIILDLKKWLGPFRVQVAGGEIFLRNDIVELVEFAAVQDVLIGMVSNGTLIDDNIARDLVKAGLKYIDISIDGIKSETHDYIRGENGVYDKAMAAIRHLKRHKEEMQSDLSIIAATVIMGKNMDELLDIVKWSEKENIAGVMFNPLGPACDNDARWYDQSELWPKKDDLNRLDKVIDELIAMKRAGSRILNSEDQFLAMKEYFRNPAIIRSESCMVGVTNYLMSCDGDVHLCFHMPPIGNFRQSPEDVWNSEAAREVRGKIKHCEYECSPGNFIYMRSLLKDIQRYFSYR
jgi:MoaA/NifB/PqqE/SkfB family radical SAM enzyme